MKPENAKDPRNKRRLGALAAALAACLPLLGGCGAVDGALREVGKQLEAQSVAVPENNGGEIDWSFVPIVRELATGTFLEGFPQATVNDTNVASKNGRDDRVIVIVMYTMDGKSGEYGFEYRKNAEGGYDLSRYGEGVRVDDL